MGSGEVIRIRKYPNRRLYDTSRSCHLTHDGVLGLIAEGKTVQVTDSRSGADITNVVLLQIIIERDPAKLQALPSALVHRAMRTEISELRAAAEQGLAGWRGASANSGNGNHSKELPRTSLGNGFTSAASTTRFGLGNGGSSLSSPRPMPSSPVPPDASSRPKAKAKRLES